MRNSWALLPCTRVLFEKNKVSLTDLNAVWNENTVYICERDDFTASGKPKIVFLASAGKLAGVEVGMRKLGRHDQTQASLGYMYVRNIVQIENGKIVKSANDEFINDKAALMVFKELNKGRWSGPCHGNKMKKDEIIKRINVVARIFNMELVDVSATCDRVQLNLPGGTSKRFNLDHTAVSIFKEHGIQLDISVKKYFMGDKLVYAATFLNVGDPITELVGVRSTYDKVMALVQEHFQSVTYDDNAVSVRECIVTYDNQQEDAMIFEPAEGFRYIVTEAEFE